MQEYEFRIADITSVIKEETEIERKIHEAADIDSYEEICSSRETLCSIYS